MNRLLLSILIVGLTTINLMAQTDLVIGRVVEESSRSPLRDVLVYWKNNKDKAVRTNLHGVYKISGLADQKVLVFEYPGKRVLSVEVLESFENELDVELRDLGTTAITASRWEQSIYEIPASVVIISRQEIEQNGYITLQEVLENIAGVFTLDHRSESDVTIGIRGFWGPFNRNVMIQVNGVNMLSERQNDFPLNKINVPVEAIDRIEVVRGPMSVIYGAGASFGVINIITNQADRDYDGTVSTSFGSQNGQRNFVRYAFDRQGLKLSFNASTWRRDGFQEEWDDFISPSAYDADAASNLQNGRVDAVTEFAYRGQEINPERYSKRNESLNLSIGYGGFSANLNYATSNFGFSFLEPGPTDRNKYESSTINTQFGYRKPTDKGNFDYELKFSVMSSIVDAQYHYYFPEARPFGQDRVASYRAEANARYVILNSTDRSNVDLDLIGGLWYSSNRINNSKYDAPETGLINWFLGLSENASLNTLAGYTQLNLKTELRNGTFNVVAGGRLEQQESYQVEYNTQSVRTGDISLFSGEIPATPLSLIPRIAVIYSTQDSTELKRHYIKGMYGQAINQVGAALNASQANTFNLIGADNPNIQPFLGPEKIETLELGYTFVNDKANYEVNLNLFRNDLKDLVSRKVSTVSSGGFRTIRENGGELETFGAELIFKKRARDKYFLGKSFTLNTSLDVSYQKTVIANETELILQEVLDTASFEPSFSPQLLGNFRFTASTGNMSFGAQLNYVGDMNAYLLLTNGVPEYIGDQTDDYLRLGLNYRIDNIKFGPKEPNKKGGLFFNARVSNFLNTQYRYPTYTINPWADRGMLGRARQLLFTLGYKF